MSTRPAVTVYVRPECHLCEEALDLLHDIDPLAAGSATIIDIDCDDTLLKQYLEAIPVIVIDGAEVSRLLPDRDVLAEALASG